MAKASPSLRRILLAVMRHEVMQKLRHNGVEMSDAPVSADGDDVASTLYIHRSPELVDILRSLMYRSDNMMAEAMLRSVAPGQSRASAVKTELDMWETRDVDTRRVVIEDGSGLSRNDRLTPMFLANVFTWMASHYKAPDYVSLFPKAGCDGTLKSFLRDTPLEAASGVEDRKHEGSAVIRRLYAWWRRTAYARYSHNGQRFYLRTDSFEDRDRGYVALYVCPRLCASGQASDQST